MLIYPLSNLTKSRRNARMALLVLEINRRQREQAQAIFDQYEQAKLKTPQVQD